MGALSGYKVGISTPVAMDIELVTAGAVNSWLAGNFNYDLSDAYPIVSKGTLSDADAASLAKLSVTQDSAGFFNLPVCQVLDLRSFPNAAAGTGYANSKWASASSCLLFTDSFLSTFIRLISHQAGKALRKINADTVSTALCGCASGSAVGGASNGKNIKFWDSVSQKIQSYVLPAAVKGQNGDCPGDLNPALDETPQ